MTRAGDYKFKVIATETFSREVNDQVSFILRIDCHIIDLKPLYDSATQTLVHFTIGEDDVQLRLPKYQPVPAQCMTPDLLVDLEIQSEDEESPRMPSFMRLFPTNSLVQFEGGSDAEADKLFTFRVKATANVIGVSNDAFTFRVKTVSNNAAPQFAEPLDDITVGLANLRDNSEAQVFPLPEIFDAEEDDIQMVRVSMGNAAAWLSYDQQ